MCEIGPETGWLRSELLGRVVLNAKPDSRGGSGRLWLQWCSRRLLRDWGHRRCAVRHAANTIHTCRLRLQRRRQNGIDAGLHWLLGLRLEAPKACRLWHQARVSSLLLLNPELGLRLEAGGLRRQSILELSLRHETSRLRLESVLEPLLVQFGQTLSRRSNLRSRLRNTSQLRLQWRRTKRVWLLREVLGCGEGSLRWRRKQRALPHVLRRLGTLS